MRREMLRQVIRDANKDGDTYKYISEVLGYTKNTLCAYVNWRDCIWSKKEEEFLKYFNL